MRSSICVMCVAVVVGALAGSVSADSYVGSLTTVGGGLTGSGDWGAGPSVLSWEINELSSGHWQYRYELAVAGQQGAGISHFGLETSEGLTVADLSNIGSNWSLAAIEDGLIAVSNHVPSLGDFQGLKFEMDTTGGSETLLWIQFEVDRMPIPGDFHAKGGLDNNIWNVGFTCPDIDTAGPGHLYVPDTYPSDPPPPVPEPLTALAVGLGLVQVGRYVRKRAAA